MQPTAVGRREAVMPTRLVAVIGKQEPVQLTRLDVVAVGQQEAVQPTRLIIVAAAAVVAFPIFASKKKLRLCFPTW